MVSKNASISWAILLGGATGGKPASHTWQPARPRRRSSDSRRGFTICCDLVRTTVGRKFNAKLRGWQNYFSYGSLNQAYRIVDGYVYQCVRHFLRRRHKATNSRGT